MGAIAIIKEIIQAFGIKILQKDGYEADDILASLALKFSDEDFDVVIITGDKDMLQLLNKNITVLNPGTWKIIDYDTFHCFYEIGSYRMPVLHSISIERP